MTKNEHQPHLPETTIHSTSTSPKSTEVPMHEPDGGRITITVTTRTRQGNLYTYPSRTEHYQESDLNEDIMKNPSLYMGSADF